MNLRNMLTAYREKASPLMADQVKEFRALPASEQRELLFYIAAEMAMVRAATNTQTEQKAALQ